MIEDKLNHEERLRLECIAQAIAYNAISKPSVEITIQTAKSFEQYIKGLK